VGTARARHGEDEAISVLLLRPLLQLWPLRQLLLLHNHRRRWCRCLALLLLHIIVDVLIVEVLDVRLDAGVLLLVLGLEPAALEHRDNGIGQVVPKMGAK
jgi:hypothetical protein